MTKNKIHDDYFPDFNDSLMREFLHNSPIYEHAAKLKGSSSKEIAKIITSDPNAAISRSHIYPIIFVDDKNDETLVKAKHVLNEMMKLEWNNAKSHTSSISLITNISKSINRYFNGYKISTQYQADKNDELDVSVKYKLLHADDRIIIDTNERYPTRMEAAKNLISQVSFGTACVTRHTEAYKTSEVSSSSVEFIRSAEIMEKYKDLSEEIRKKSEEKFGFKRSVLELLKKYGWQLDEKHIYRSDQPHKIELMLKSDFINDRLIIKCSVAADPGKAKDFVYGSMLNKIKIFAVDYKCENKTPVKEECQSFAEKVAGDKDKAGKSKNGFKWAELISNTISVWGRLY